MTMFTGSKPRYRKQGSGKIADSQWKYLSSELPKDWVAKPKKEAKSFQFVEQLLTEVVERKKVGPNQTNIEREWAVCLLCVSCTVV